MAWKETDRLKRPLIALSVLVALLLSLLALVSCEGDPIRDEIYFNSIHLTGQAVGTPPLKIDAGELLTTTEPGTLEYDGTGIYLTNTNHRRYISQAADSIITSQVVSNTIAETEIFSGVLNADELKVSRVYRLSLYGEISTDSATDTVRIRVKLDGTTLFNAPSTPGVVANVPFYGWTVITIRSVGVAGDLSAYGYIRIDDSDNHDNKPTVAIDTTAINNITITAEWDTAAVNNMLQLDQAFLEVLD